MVGGRVERGRSNKQGFRKKGAKRTNANCTEATRCTSFWKQQDLYVYILCTCAFSHLMRTCVQPLTGTVRLHV